MDHSSPGLLRLPVLIRIDIYKLCGLVRPCPIDLNVEAVRQQWSATDLATREINSFAIHQCHYVMMHSTHKFFDPGLPPGLECFCPSLPHQLLLVCRMMHLEVETVLYGLNQFKVSRHLPGDHLKVLNTLSWRALQLMRSLHISLSEVLPFGISRPHDYPVEKLDCWEISGHQTIKRWEALCSDVLCDTAPQVLKFSLSCNVSDVQTARLVIQPLKKLQIMAEASLCLAADPGRKQIKEMARNATLQLVSKEEGTEERWPPSRSWNLLPRELRLHILKYTELVDRHSLLSQQALEQNRLGFEIHRGNPKYRSRACCQNCNSTLSTCTCHNIHAAHSTTCTCPAVPPLFTVSKTMHADATEIFFSCNRFLFSGDDFAASRRFIENLPTTATRSLRTIDLQVSYPKLRSMRKPGSQTERDWDALIAMLPCRLQMSKVWLSVDTDFDRDDIMYLEREEYDSWLSAATERLFDPLYKHLRGVAKPGKFHVFWPWKGNVEEEVERKVMGIEYERSRNGKAPLEKRYYRNPHGMVTERTYRLL